MAADFQKAIITKEDGRYLIYYTFASASSHQGTQTDRSKEKETIWEKAEERK